MGYFSKKRGSRITDRILLSIRLNQHLHLQGIARTRGRGGRYDSYESTLSERAVFVGHRNVSIKIHAIFMNKSSQAKL